MQFRSLSLAAVALALFAMTAWSHHSHGNYQQAEFKQLEGTVKQIRWLVPHSWIYLEVKDAKGQPAVWLLEGGSPGALEAEGWKKDDIKAGDNIKVRCHPLKDGSTGCLLGFVTTKTIVDKEFD